MGKRLFLVLFIYLFTFFSIDIVSDAEERKEASTTMDMVIALDISKSMNDEIKKDVTKISEAKKLTEQLCVICKEFDIELSCLTFSNQGEIHEIFKNQKINSEKKVSSLIKKIQKIKYDDDGDCTDQLAAFEKAEKIISNGSSKKNILLYSLMEN